MLVNVFHDSPWEHRRLQLAGVVLIATLAALVALSIAIYNKKFTDATTVTVKAERAGLQLAKFGDVRLHGALVGRVSEIKSDGKLAVITLSLSPDAARTISDDVSVRILPTTLFGQNFLELVPPDSAASAGRLRDGVVIPESRVETNVELQTILADLYPLLRSVRPADLNATLYALAHALQGKGDQLGDTLVSLEDYLSRMNTELPRLRKDLTLLSEVSRTYELAAPDLIKVLKNATVTARTVTQKKGDLARALSSLTGLARTSRVTLNENEDRLIRQTRSARPLLALLDTYSPEIPCLLIGLDRQIPNSQAVFADDIIHQTLELGAPQRTAYTAADAPAFGEIGHGPECYGLPDDYPKPWKDFVNLKDGSEKDAPDGGIP